ncbi:MAG: NAD(P)H-hydrate dehydratase [Bacteroidota bacterium]
MKILSAEQIRAVDAYTIASTPIASIDLMEKAAKQCFEWIAKRYPNSTHCTLFCGTGNNGGDGLALARMLHEGGYAISLYVVHAGHKAGADFTQNQKRLLKNDKIRQQDITTEADIPEISPATLVIDALFGTGLNEPLSGIAAETVYKINSSGATVIAIDMPSGLIADSSCIENVIVKAHHTLSFQLPKLAFMMPENESYVGIFHLLNIDLSEAHIANSPTQYTITDAADIRAILKPRTPFSHKGTYGHVALLAGSHGKMGAAVLAAKACLHSGAGLLTVHVPACGYEILQTALPEAMVITDDDDNYLTTPFELGRYTAVAIGPGIGTAMDTAAVLHHVVRHYHGPLVVDADAINTLGENEGWTELLPKGCILTPHPREFERLAGKTKNNFDRLMLQQKFSMRHGVYIVLKGHFTSITCPDGHIYFNPTGNAGMAKGGNGDVLTGIVTALLAQGYSSHDAALAGTYLHGLAGDIAVKRTGEWSMLGTDLIDSIGAAIAEAMRIG